MKRLFVFFFLFLGFLGFTQETTVKSTKIDSSFFYISEANLYKKSRIFDKALEYANKAIIYSERQNNNFSLANGYQALGIIYYDFRKYDLAIEKLLRSVAIYSSLEPTSELALSYYNLGLCFMNTGNYTRAESYFDKSTSIYQSLDLSNAKNMVQLQKALLYLEKKEVEIAERTFEELTRLPKDKKIFEMQSEAFYQLGNLKAKQGINNLAINYLTRGYQISISDQNLEQQIKFCKLLSELYEKMGDSQKSLIYLKSYTKLKDSLQSISKNNEQNIVSERAKVNDIMKSMEKLDKENKEQEKEGKFSKLINILSIALITILSLLSLSLYKNNIIRNKSNELLRDKNNELEIAKERMEKASKARAEFLSTVSHELRTPLNAINGISHILLEEKPKASQIEYLKSLKFSGNYLLTYINEILEINRIESNNIEVEQINFNFKELLHNIQNSLKEQASQNNNEFKLEIGNEVPDNLIGDPTKLSQIFINLINNALKFTHNGIITVKSSVIHKSEEDCSLKFEVKDTGIGIPKDKQESIFESFSQGSVEINRKYGGTGLGLTIVRRLVSLMGGKISVESEINKGSTFSFTLDFKIGEETVPVNVNFVSDETIFINKKILLVEDNKINQMITKKIIEKKRMICELCETGEDAILKLKENKYDLVLMDVHLPGINGTIATEEIRKFDKQTPIIALTAISLDENRDMLMSFGMNDVITKPFNPDNLYKVIETNLLIETNIA